MLEREAGFDGATLLAQDDASRSEALVVTRSFLVQAPAGSGKTELLIQRYLALLSAVSEPEQVLALTFTRKAAGEMRGRVQKALADAMRGTSVDKKHEETTRRLAVAALAHDDARGWNLVHHPARMRIMTFDALSTSLVRAAPLSAMLGPGRGYADDATELYRAAATAALADAPADDPHWRRLLGHLHNNAGNTVELLARLLAKRDQLLRQIGDRAPEDVKALLQAALEADVNDSLAALHRAFPPGVADTIAELAPGAAACLAAEPEPAPLAAQLAGLARRRGLPSPTIDALPDWRALACWLLTKQGTPRSVVNKSRGFPAPGNSADAKLRVERIRAMKQAIDSIGNVPGLPEALHAASNLPPDAMIGLDAWGLVESLLPIVRSSAAHLALTFAEHGSTDFVQANIAALQALGEEGAPTELLERLDYRLSHLLIDEFQDTSATQLELVHRLTSGWTPGEDGRTIFAVGDPMQSIYRFREAEVRLFIEAQQQRAIAGIPVDCLTLRRNFRSQRGVVAWINDKFPQVLGSISDPTRGAVRFEPATAVLPPLPGDAVTVDLAVDAGEEARHVVGRVRAAIAAGSTDIAILVRARAHLAAVLPALRAEGIAFTAVELDKLGQRQAVQDLLALTRALLQPADRLSCLALLRAPWCGLALADLFVMAQATTSILDALDDPGVAAALSPDGRQRVARIAPILRAARDAHGVASVASRVRGAWLALGGPSCLSDALDLETADRCLEVLAASERAGDIPDWQSLVAALDDLNASADAERDTVVQVMTMHKAKGLEFDTVILPGLGRKGRGPSHEILRWRSRERGLLIAPSSSPGAEPDPVYTYLKKLETEESNAELGRLLYVACTRAKSRLHLVAAPGVRVDRKTGEVTWAPSSTSSLAKLWAGLVGDVPVARPPPEAEVGEDKAPPLARLPLAFTVARPEDGLASTPLTAGAQRDEIPFDWAAEMARTIGIVAHRLLARIAQDGLQAWPASRIDSLATRVAGDLASAGFTAQEARVATARVQTVVSTTLADMRGRWIFDPSHQDARSEWSLAGMDGDRIAHVVVDRTFVAGGVRWIVDFKTGSHEGAEVDQFLASEEARYRPQLSRYARFVHALDPARPIRLALYYPLVPDGFRDWAYRE